MVAALERADNEAAEASAHQGPASAYVAGDLAAVVVADLAAVGASATADGEQIAKNRQKVKDKQK